MGTESEITKYRAHRESRPPTKSALIDSEASREGFRIPDLTLRGSGISEQEERIQ